MQRFEHVLGYLKAIARPSVSGYAVIFLQEERARAPNEWFAAAYAGAEAVLAVVTMVEADRAIKAIRRLERESAKSEHDASEPRSNWHLALGFGIWNTQLSFAS